MNGMTVCGRPIVGTPPMLDGAIALLETQQRLFAELAGIHAAWFASSWDLHLRLLADAGALASRVPSWFVWHNGAEQLA